MLVPNINIDSSNVHIGKKMYFSTSNVKQMKIKCPNSAVSVHLGHSMSQWG